MPMFLSRASLRFSRSASALAACAALAAFAAGLVPARAGDRSVTIIEGAPEPVTPGPAPTPATPDLDAPIRAEDPAGIDLAILPNPDLKVGTKIAFRVGTKTAGYLLLVDINAEGKLTQIYPNVSSLAHVQGPQANSNLIQPGRPVTLPDAKNPFARFKFVAEPPLGTGIVVAILSDRPVQVVDLPELPPEVTDQQAKVDFLYGELQKLRIASSDAPDTFAQGVWSFAAKSYAIR